MLGLCHSYVRNGFWIATLALAITPGRYDINLLVVESLMIVMATGLDRRAIARNDTWASNVNLLVLVSLMIVMAVATGLDCHADSRNDRACNGVWIAAHMLCNDCVV